MNDERKLRIATKNCEPLEKGDIFFVFSADPTTFKGKFEHHYTIYNYRKSIDQEVITGSDTIEDYSKIIGKNV